MIERFPKPATVATIFGMLWALGIPMSRTAYGQQPQPAPSQITVGGVRITGIPDDWTHHHVVFSNPGTEAEAIANGTHGRWLKVVNDPRYIIQQLHRGQPAQGPYAADVARVLAARGLPTTLPPVPVAPAPGPSSLPPPVAIPGAHPAPRFAAQPDGPGSVASSAQLPGISGMAGETPDLKRRWRRDWSENLGGTSQGLTTFPAKYSFSTTGASCSDFAVFNTSAQGSSTQATVVAYNNIYVGTGGCASSLPTVYWEYNTGGYVHLSPVLSLDGSQVAFVQNAGSGTAPASLVLLKWKNTGATVTTLSNTAAGSYRSCTAPCMTTLTFTNSGFDGFSAPYYDYANDVIYVGDNGSYLHKFTGVFNGSPAEAGSPWPVLVNEGTVYPLVAPVQDSVTGNIFVGTSYNGTAGAAGGLECLVTSAGVFTSYFGQLDHEYGIWDAVLLDSSAQETYTFIGDCASSTNCGTHNDTVVLEATTSFSAGETYALGTGLYPMFAGTFDNIYFTSSTPSTPTGHLYVLSPTSSGSYQQLLQITISGSTPGDTMTSATYDSSDFGYGTIMSPLTEFYNATAGRDGVFFGAEAAASGCSTTGTVGCVYGVNVTSGAVPGAAYAFSSEAGGTSGIIIDNGAVFTGADQIYFTTLSSGTCGAGGSGVCAIQASQAAP